MGAMIFTLTRFSMSSDALLSMSVEGGLFEDFFSFMQIDKITGLVVFEGAAIVNTKGADKL